MLVASCKVILNSYPYSDGSARRTMRTDFLFPDALICSCLRLQLPRFTRKSPTICMATSLLVARILLQVPRAQILNLLKSANREP